MDKYKELIEEIKKRGIKIDDTTLKEVLFNGSLGNLYDLVDKSKYKTREEFLNYYNDLNKYKLDNIADKIINQRQGVLQNRDGSFSTHLMSSGTVDNGVGVVYPTLQQNEIGEWYSPRDPFNEARKKDEILEFPNEKMAEDIAKGRWKKTKVFNKLNKKYNKRLKSFSKNFNKDKIKVIYNYFIQKGLTPEQASGIAGNLAQESAFNPTVTNDIGAFGVAQWLGSRKQGLINYAKKNKKDYGNLNTQLDYMWHELNTNEKRALEKLYTASTPEEAAHLFVKYYERSGEKEGDRGYHNRLDYASNIYQMFAFSNDGQKMSDKDVIENGVQKNPTNLDKYFSINDDLGEAQENIKKQQQAKSDIAKSQYVKILQDKVTKFNIIKDFIEGMNLKPVDISYN